VRFWPSPDGRRLLSQTAWRDRTIRIVEADGEVNRLPSEAVEGLPPTYSRYPLAFLRWFPDSRHILAVSTHTPEARGYAFLSVWKIDTETGERKLLEERLLLLSKQIADWRLEPLPPDARLTDAIEALHRMTSAANPDGWVRQAARIALERCRARLYREINR
jgi:hypothetical protein